jgi:toxin YhaV
MLKLESKYLLRYHHFYAQRVSKLKEQVKELKKRLDPEQFKEHEIVKLAFRIRGASQETIPQDPNRPEYQLRDELRKYRRYKRGLQRYRIIFCFSSQPPIIVYLYVNDEKRLRKDGDRNDPYEEFKKQTYQGYFSHNPSDPKLQKWINNFVWS